MKLLADLCRETGLTDWQAKKECKKLDIKIAYRVVKGSRFKKRCRRAVMSDMDYLKFVRSYKSDNGSPWNQVMCNDDLANDFAMISLIQGGRYDEA